MSAIADDVDVSVGAADSDIVVAAIVANIQAVVFIGDGTAGAIVLVENVVVVAPTNSDTCTFGTSLAVVCSLISFVPEMVFLLIQR